MNAMAEIDKAGRIVVPKKMRDALHLVPGTRLTLHQEGEAIILQPESKPRGLYLKRGTLVYDAGRVPASNVMDWITEDRAARMKSVLGNVSRP